MPVNESCRHLKIEFAAFSVLVQFATAEECRELLAESRELVEFCVQNYRDARSQPNRKSSPKFFEVLSVLCAASETVCSEFVQVGGLDDLRAALDLDPNGSDSEGYSFFYEVLYGSQILLQILLAEHAQHVETVKADPHFLEGSIHFIFVWLLL